MTRSNPSPNLFARASRGVRGWLARSLGWETTMFGDLLDGGGAAAAELTQPYKRSAWVRSAIQFVSAPISMRPLIITADKRGGDVRVDDPALTAFWEKPARNAGGPLSRQDFVEALVGLLKLKGQAFLVMDETWFAPRAKRNPLWLAKPAHMHAVIDGGELIGWVLTDQRGKSAALTLDQVIQIKFWNPYDDILGLSEWEAAMIAAASDYAAGNFAMNLAKNNGDRGPFVIGKGGMFSDEQIVQITAQLRAKRELNRRGDFRAAFIPGDVEVQDPAINAVDSAYVTQRLENRKEIYAAFGVPMSFADAQASYSIGSASDRFRLIEDTCMPLGAKLCEAFETVSMRFLADRRTLFVEFDWDSHSTMQQVRAERFETATKAVDRGMPWAKASDYFALKLPRFTGDDVGRIPFSMQEIERDAPPGPADPPEPDPVEDLEKLFRARSLAKATPETPRQLTAKDMAAWKRVHKHRAPWEKKYKSRISRLLMDARGETLRNIAALPEEKSVAKSFDVLDIIFGLDAWLADWVRGLGGISRAALDAATQELWSEELLRDDPLTLPAAQVSEALRVRENRIMGAGEKVWESIKNEIQAGIDAGDTTDELADRVRSKFSELDKGRALVIAKTETTAIYETGRDMVFHLAGVTHTQWLTSGLGNERLSHLGANHQIREMGKAFLVGGYELYYPGDPEAPPKEVINCNCVRVAVANPEGGDIQGNDDDEIPY